MSSTVEQIKERLDIADVVGSYLKLEKAGGDFRARCPFHNEKTPSFFVSPSRQTYHCFGCNKGGDILSFVEEIEGLDFLGSLKILADRAGVQVKRENKNVKSEKDKLFAVLEEATRYFESNLRGQEDVIDYLKKRGLVGETAKRFRLGYAPSGWNGLYDELKSRGYSDELMEKAGLVKKGDKGFYDRFRSRIMFPVADTAGRIVGFSGRIFGEESDKTAKYINSPETELYNKSKILFGFDKAKMAIRKEGFCILVEGQMDLLMSHQAGFANTVAVSGTALTGEHLTLIKRLTNNLVVAFDPDDAGIAASRKSVDTALALDFDVKVVYLPKDLDPADLIVKDKGEWASRVGNAQHVVDFYINVLAEKDMDQREFRVKVGEIVLPYVARLSNKINQAHFVSEIARKLGISEDPIWEELKNIKVDKDTVPVARTEKGSVSPPQSSRREMVERKLLGVLFWQEEAKSPTIDVEKIKNKYIEIVGEEHLKEKKIFDEESKKEFIFEAEIYYGDTDLEKELSELIRYLEEEVLKEEFTCVMSDLRVAENKGDTKTSSSLLKKASDISKKINTL